MTAKGYCAAYFTLEIKMRFQRSHKLMISYYGAYWAGDKDDRDSTTGNVFILAGGALVRGIYNINNCLLKGGISWTNRCFVDSVQCYNPDGDMWSRPFNLPEPLAGNKACTLTVLL